MSTVQSCQRPFIKAGVNKHCKVEGEAIPIGFGNNPDMVLLCLIGPFEDYRDKAMQKHIPREYKGAYEFVKESQMPFKEMLALTLETKEPNKGDIVVGNPYEILEEGDLFDGYEGKYGDLEKYRYFLHYRISSINFGYDEDTHRNNIVTYTHFFIRDRKSQEFYECDFRSAYMNDLMREYIRNIEDVRSANALSHGYE